MENTPRNYIKSDPELEAKSLPSGKKLVAAVESPPDDIDFPIGYQKGEGIELPKSFWVIVSGGQDRERTYFKVLLGNDSFKRIKLQFVADPKRLNPDGMLETSQTLKKRYNSSSADNEEPDRFYLISDVDHFYNDLVRIAPTCIKESFKLIISNSCFEVWLYYAYRKELPDFKVPPDYRKISWQFKGWLNNTIKGGIQTHQAIFNIRENISNAKSNCEIDGNNIPKLFSTNMFQLAEDLLPLIEPELNQIMEKNKTNELKGRMKNSD